MKVVFFSIKIYVFEWAWGYYGLWLGLPDPGWSFPGQFRGPERNQSFGLWSEIQLSRNYLELFVDVKKKLFLEYLLNYLLFLRNRPRFYRLASHVRISKTAFKQANYVKKSLTSSSSIFNHRKLESVKFHQAQNHIKKMWPKTSSGFALHICCQ